MSCAHFGQQYAGPHFKGIGQRRVLGQPAGRPLGDRMSRQGVASRRAASEKSASAATDGDLFGDDEDAFPYRVAARQTFDSLMQDDSQKNREQITEALAKIHEPLQQYTVLFSAMKEVDENADISPDKKRALKNTFNEMMTNLVKRDRGGIRKGLCEGAEYSPVAARIDAASVSRGMSHGLRDLRFKIGARAKGGVDEALTAMVMVKALLNNVGPLYAEEALDSVCSRLMPGLRTLSAFKEAAYFLTVSDATTFSIARTGLKIARDFKRDLMDKAGVLCKPHHVEAAVNLFTAAEQGWGKGKAIQLVNLLVDLKNLPPLTKAKVYTCVRNATNLLPVMAWPSDKQANRIELLEDMDRQVVAAYAEIPPLTTKAERNEEEWRNMFAAGRAPNLTEIR
jgi:hypothetical protein